jgi:transposase
MQQGRPTKYKEELDKIAYELALLGYSDANIAKEIGIAESTIYEWKLTYKTFSEALKEGKAKASAKVAKSLYERALGYTTTEKRVERNELGEVVKEVEITKYVAPDTSAAALFLKAKEPDLWREQKHVDLTNSDASLSMRSLDAFYSGESDDKSED